MALPSTALFAMALALSCSGSPSLDLPPSGLVVRPLEIEEPGPLDVAKGGRGNLIVISLDTLRADHLSVYGYERNTSPSMDRFAGTAVVFEHAYSHAPRTAPAHMSLFTGVYPEEHGIVNFEDGDNGRLNDEVPTLATMMRRAGYRTQAYVANGNLSGELGFDQGFDNYEDSYADSRSKFARATTFIEECVAGSGETVPPFFLFVHTYDIHDPYLAADPDHIARFTDPAYSGRIVNTWAELRGLTDETDWHRQAGEFWELVDRTSQEDIDHLVDLYDACIRTTDDHLGGFLQRLEDLGLFRNTTVVLLSDHGEEFGEHGSFKHVNMYDECLHVPLMIRFASPEIPVSPGLRVPGPVRLVDVVPTLLEDFGLPIPSHLQGDSLIPLIRGVNRGARPVFSQFSAPGYFSLTAERWKLIERPDRPRTLDLGHWTIPLPGTTPHNELYDRTTDPGERNDLSKIHPDIVRHLLDELRQARTAMKDNHDLLPHTESIEIDDKTLEQLKALGYIGNWSSRA